MEAAAAAHAHEAAQEAEAHYAASEQMPNPSQYASSSDYIAAMRGIERAQDMSPEELRRMQWEVEQQEREANEIEPPVRHSLADIDNLVREGMHQSSSDSFHFDASKLKNPQLARDLASLQDEGAIQTAMLHTQEKIRAIAAELERHNQANGGGVDHSDGIEIDMQDLEMPNMAAGQDHQLPPLPAFLQ